MAKGHAGKVAVITGAANGLGQAFAKRLAEEGVDIAVVDVADGAATVKAVEAAGRKAHYVKCDVSSESDVAKMAKEVLATFGRADIVINTTSGGPGGATDTISSFIFREYKDRSNVGYGTMIAEVYLIVIIIFIVLLLWSTSRFMQRHS